MSRISQKGSTGPLSLTASGSFQSSTDANLATLVGTRWDLADGREVILVSVDSATTTTAGQLYQDAALIPNHQGLTTTAVQAYSSNGNVPATVTVTLGATALTANYYQGGFAIVTEGTGLGQTLKIASNPAALSSGTGVVITLEDAPNTALVAANSKISLVPAHGANVIVSPTTPTNVTAGIALYPIAASSYGFLCSKGIVSSLSDNKPAAAGIAIGPSVTTAGTTTLVTQTGTTGTLSSAVIGTALVLQVSAKCMPVFINV